MANEPDATYVFFAVFWHLFTTFYLLSNMLIPARHVNRLSDHLDEIYVLPMIKAVPVNPDRVSRSHTGG